ncbi:UNVERIFIED_ORG: branched-chain amino acid ABC transporter permease (plasmid) [Roseateles sp. XES5]|nr:branched-chain amino acid ABC transporter permease [Roseateles sp. XES5]
MPLLLLAAGAILALIAATFAFPWLEFVLTLAIAKGLAALGVAILLRGGLISIGHAMFFAVGAYATAFAMRDLGITDVFALIALSAAVSLLAGLLIGAFVVRYRAIFFAMLNLAISMVLFSLLAKFYGVTGGTDGLRVSTPTVLGMALDAKGFATFLFYAAIAAMALAGLAVAAYFRSPLGEALSAVHTNEIRLEYLGIPVRGVLLVAYAISALLAGIGGTFAAMTIGHVLPDMAYWTDSGHLVLVAVLGGVSGIAGPFVGAVFLELVHTLAAGVTDAWNMIVGAALLGVIFFLPKGLIGLLRPAKKGDLA